MFRLPLVKAMVSSELALTIRASVSRVGVDHHVAELERQLVFPAPQKHDALVSTLSAPPDSATISPAR